MQNNEQLATHLIGGSGAHQVLLVGHHQQRDVGKLLLQRK